MWKNSTGLWRNCEDSERSTAWSGEEAKQTGGREAFWNRKLLRLVNQSWQALTI